MRKYPIILLICTVLLGVTAFQASAQTRTFSYPRIAGAIVDHCSTWARNCGWAAAHRYCRRRGYQRATNWRRFRAGRTYVMGSRRYCRGGYCTGFRFVTCTRRGRYTSPPPPRRYYRYMSRWDKISGPGRYWSTGWVRNHTSATCGHYRGCNCYGRNYCGVYRSGQSTYYWPRGCRGPRWVIRCRSTRQYR